MPRGKPAVSTLEIDDQEVTLSANSTGSFSEIIDIQVPHGHRYEFPATQPLELYAYTHESGSVSSNSTDTVSLSNNLVNSPALRDIPTSNGGENSITGQYSLVVWDDNDNIQSEVDSVDYSGNSFDYTNSDGSKDNLEIYYLWQDASQVEFRRYTPDLESYEIVHQKPMRAFHEASVFSGDSQITFPESFTLNEKEHLKVMVKTGVDLTRWDNFNANNAYSPNDLDTYSYSDFSFPVRRISRK